MGEDSFGLVTSADDSSIEAKNAAEAVNPGVILKSTSASEVMMRSKSNESLDDDIGGGLRSSNRTSFKAARQHVKVDCMHDPLSLSAILLKSLVWYVSADAMFVILIVFQVSFGKFLYHRLGLVHMTIHVLLKPVAPLLTMISSSFRWSITFTHPTRFHSPCKLV